MTHRASCRPGSSSLPCHLSKGQVLLATSYCPTSSSEQSGEQSFPPSHFQLLPMLLPKQNEGHGAATSSPRADTAAASWRSYTQRQQLDSPPSLCRTRVTALEQPSQVMSTKNSCFCKRTDEGSGGCSHRHPPRLPFALGSWVQNLPGQKVHTWHCGLLGKPRALGTPACGVHHWNNPEGSLEMPGPAPGRRPGHLRASRGCQRWGLLVAPLQLPLAVWYLPILFWWL